jgi:hypothetical protein
LKILLAYDIIIDVTVVISQTDRYSILKVSRSENISTNLYKLRRESVYHFRGFYETVKVNVIFQTTHIKRINRLKAFIRWWKSSLRLSFFITIHVLVIFHITSMDVFLSFLFSHYIWTFWQLAGCYHLLIYSRGFSPNKRREVWYEYIPSNTFLTPLFYLKRIVSHLSVENNITNDFL